MSRRAALSQRVGISGEDWRALEAAARRILPSGDGPGAAEADVLGYLGWLAGHECFGPIRRRLVKGLGLLQASAVARHGHGFAACSPAQQDAVLASVQAIPHPAAHRFFSTLVNVTLIGFLCDAAYGGNRGHVGWRYLGFERRGPRIRAGEEG